MFDIKDTHQQILIGDWWKYVLIVALILGIGVLFIGLLKRQEKNYIKKFIKPNRKATSLLDTLERIVAKGESKPIIANLRILQETILKKR
jgi:hypothetical protein